MHAYCVTGGSKNERRNQIAKLCHSWKVSQYDLITLQTSDTQPTIGIAQIRTFQKQLQLFPHNSPYSAGIIEDAHLLTHDAQHALLKTLEEPPKHAKIILETDHVYALLPTIHSRCSMMSMSYVCLFSGQDISTYSDQVKKLYHASFGEIINHIDSAVTNRDEAKVWVQKLIVLLEHELTNTRTQYNMQSIITLLHAGLIALSMLSVNTNYKLVLDAIFFSLFQLDNRQISGIYPSQSELVRV